ncbi:MAG: hypothetical protein ACK40G_05470 [Cytophagaceae bacterium]
MNYPLNFVLSLYSILFISFAYSQKIPFPEISGETIEGNPITLPAALKTDFAIIGLAWSKEAEEDLLSWAQPMYNTFFPQPQKKKGLFDVSYEADVYFIGCITGLNKAAAETIKKKTKHNLDKALHPRMMYYVGDMKPYKEKMGIKDKETCHIFIVDKNRNIIHYISGKYTAQKMSKIEELIEE